MASIPTLKPSTTQGPTSSRARHTTQILQQNRNTSLNFKIQAAQVTPKPLTSHNSLLDTSLHSREKTSSSTHQNTDTSFPNLETLTSHCPTPPTTRKLHNKDNSTNYQNTERSPQMQQYKQDEETEEYPAGKGTGEMPTKPNKRGRDKEAT